MERVWTVVGACLSTGLFAACAGGGSFSPRVAPDHSLLPSRVRGGGKSGTVFQISASGKERVLYRFSADRLGGAFPEARLNIMNGKLYGTTSYGGGSYDHDGTVFSVDTSGLERVLHGFDNGDGPVAALVSLNHKLYGTTTGGGLRDCGTVFEVTTAGQERIVYSFRGYPNDGFEPTGDLIAVDGDLYGTTYSGGNQNSGGTVFKVNPSTGRETVLHRFGPGADGSEPRAGLLYLHGSFYGTTVYGGANALGTIFEVGTNGKERVLYSFRGVPDGFAPNGDLTAVDGTIYGTTVNGGSSACFNSVGCGTAFAFDPPSGEERVLHAFGVGSDGAFPLAGLVAVGRALYGTTYSGGGGMKCGGCGTIFELDVSGAERVLHSFTSGEDGKNPVAGLVSNNGVLYGTTYAGGQTMQQSK